MDIGKAVGSPSSAGGRVIVSAQQPTTATPRQEMNPEDTADHNNVDESVEDPETDSYPQQGISQNGEFGQTAKGEAALKAECNVCGSPAAAHLHYGAISCYSCRAFFRRGRPRQMRCIFGNNQCKITKYNRTNCKFCRYNKCIEVGMIPEKVDATLKKKQERLAAAAAAEAVNQRDPAGSNRETEATGGGPSDEPDGPDEDTRNKSSAPTAASDRDAAAAKRITAPTAGPAAASRAFESVARSAATAAMDTTGPDQRNLHEKGGSKTLSDDGAQKSTKHLGFIGNEMPSNPKNARLNIKTNQQLMENCKGKTKPFFHGDEEAQMDYMSTCDYQGSGNNDASRKEMVAKDFNRLAKQPEAMDVDSDNEGDNKMDEKQALHHQSINNVFRQHPMFGGPGCSSGNPQSEEPRSSWLAARQRLEEPARLPEVAMYEQRLASMHQADPQRIEMLQKYYELSQAQSLQQHRNKGNSGYLSGGNPFNATQNFADRLKGHNFLPVIQRPPGSVGDKIPSDAAKYLHNPLAHHSSDNQHNSPMPNFSAGQEQKPLFHGSSNWGGTNFPGRHQPNVRNDGPFELSMQHQLHAIRGLGASRGNHAPSNQTSVIQRGERCQDRSAQQPSSSGVNDHVQVKVESPNVPQAWARAQTLKIQQQLMRERDAFQRSQPHWSDFMLAKNMFRSHLDPGYMGGAAQQYSYYGTKNEKNYNMSLYNQYCKKEEADNRMDTVYQGHNLPLVQDGRHRIGVDERNIMEGRHSFESSKHSNKHHDISQQLNNFSSRSVNVNNQSNAITDRRPKEAGKTIKNSPNSPFSSDVFPSSSTTAMALLPPSAQYDTSSIAAYQDSSNSGSPPASQVLPKETGPVSPDTTQGWVPDLQTLARFEYDSTLQQSLPLQTSTNLAENFDEALSSGHNDFESMTSNIGSQVVPDYLPDLSDLETLLSESITDQSDLSVISSGFRAADNLLDFENDGMFGPPHHHSSLHDITDKKKRNYDDSLEDTKVPEFQPPSPKRQVLELGSSIPLKKRRRMYQLEYPIEHGINKKVLPVLTFTGEEELQLIDYIDRIEEYQNKRVEFLLRNFRSYRELLISYLNCTKLDSKVPFSKKIENTLCILGLEFTKANAAKMFAEMNSLSTDTRRTVLHSTYPPLYVIFFSILEGNTGQRTWIEQQEKTLYITRKTHSLIMDDAKGLTNVRSISIKDQERFTSPWALTRADEDKFDYTISLVGRLVGHDKRLQALFHMLVMLTPDSTDTPLAIQSDSILLRMQAHITKLMYRYLTHRHNIESLVKEEKPDPATLGNESSVMKLTADLPYLEPADKTRMFIHLIDEVHDCAKIMRKRSLPGQI